MLWVIYTGRLAIELLPVPPFLGMKQPNDRQDLRWISGYLRLVSIEETCDGQLSVWRGACALRSTVEEKHGLPMIHRTLSNDSERFDNSGRCHRGTGMD